MREEDELAAYDAWVKKSMPLDDVPEHLGSYADLITQEMRDDDVYFGIKARAKELTQCPRCELYTDDPEHWCGSVALVCWYDIPMTFRYLSDKALLNFSNMKE